MIRQVIKESQAIDVNPAKAKGVVKALSGKASTPRRSPRKTGKQDTEVHSIPYKYGIKMMSEREASECAKYGEVLRWSTDSGEDEAYPQHDLAGETPTTRLEVNAVSPMEGVSPCLSEFESPGFLSRRKEISRQAKAKRGHYERAKNVKGKSRDHSEDVVPVSKVLKRKAPASSDSEDDNVPLASILVTEKVVALAEVTAELESDAILVPKIVEIEAVRRSGRRLNTLIEGKRHGDSDSDDNLVPITATLTKPLKGLPTPVIPTGYDIFNFITSSFKLTYELHKYQQVTR